MGCAFAAAAPASHATHYRINALVKHSRQPLRGLLPYSSVATTADLYVHVPPHVDQEAADRTADYIFRSGHLETGLKT